VLTEAWNSTGQFRRFEYHPLCEFGLVEVQPGFLFLIKILDVK